MFVKACRFLFLVMSVTSNITFVISPLDESRFLLWMREFAIPALFCREDTFIDYSLKKVIEIAGETPSPEHGLSIALQVQFRSKEDAYRWTNKNLDSVLVRFHSEFGPEAAFFITLLENIEV